jgi:hypothetical protein
MLSPWLQQSNRSSRDRHQSASETNSRHTRDSSVLTIIRLLRFTTSSRATSRLRRVRLSGRGTGAASNGLRGRSRRARSRCGRRRGPPCRGDGNLVRSHALSICFVPLPVNPNRACRDFVIVCTGCNSGSKLRQLAIYSCGLTKILAKEPGVAYCPDRLAITLKVDGAWMTVAALGRSQVVVIESAQVRTYVVVSDC